MLIIGNGSVITRDPELPYLADGAVAVQGEEILAVGPCADLKAAYPDAEFLDARGGVIIPRISSRSSTAPGGTSTGT